MASNISTKNQFSATIEIIGVNPFVFLPKKILATIFHQAGKNKGKIPVKIKIDGHEFIQTLVKYSEDWRLYLNTPMRKAIGKDVGDAANFTVEYDPIQRIMPMHPKLQAAVDANQEAKKKFEVLSPSLQLEIKRYIMNLKTEITLDKNVERAINFLLGKERFIGRDKP
jgi:uncharacterized protein YdeI (YjbR/CyaY-like superfamily)